MLLIQTVGKNPLKLKNYSHYEITVYGVRSLLSGAAIHWAGKPIASRGAGLAA